MAAPPVSIAAARPPPGIRRTLYVVGICVWVTGVLWWTFDKYMLERSEFGVSENPLQVWWLRLHAGAAMVMVWLFGYLCAIHVQRNWRGGVSRNSGLLFVATLAFLTITGYLLYYVESDRLSAQITLVHWIVGLCAPLAFLLHWGLNRLAAARAASHAVADRAPVAAAAPAARVPAPGLID